MKHRPRALLNSLTLGTLPKLLLCAVATVFQLQAAPPNILIINVDDLDFDEINAYDYRDYPSNTGMQAAGYSLDDIPLPLTQNGEQMTHGELLYFKDPRMLTPHIDRLSNQGAKFERFYVTSATCTPSRYTLLTGRVASRSPGLLQSTPEGIPLNIRWHVPILPREPTIVWQLKELGYLTGISGKWHNGFDQDSKVRIANTFGFELPLGVPSEADPTESEVIRKVRESNVAFVSYLEEDMGFDWAQTVFNGNKEAWVVPESTAFRYLGGS